MLYEVLKEKCDQILEIASKHGIQNLRIFGSVARFEDGPRSDLDLLVDVEEGKSLFDLIGFKLEMEELLGIKVDVQTVNSINWSIKETILREAINL